ncbi:MAG: hypothetical protein KY434_00410 [Actinobacteria bacterium]|nr:hypothetical protein [Actinomycetota bacterium]
MLHGPHPQELLHLTSSLLAAVDPRGEDPVARARGEAPAGLTLAELAGSFAEIRCPETTALLTVLAEMSGDELVVQRIRRELAARDDGLPAWLQRLSPVSVDRALVMSHVLGDGDNVVLAVRTGTGHDMTVIVYIDHNLGTVVKDGFVLHEPADRAMASFRSAAGEDPDVVFGELGLADARARITGAIEDGAITFPTFQTDTWPAARPLVEWVVRQLPEGGSGNARPEWSDEDRGALTEAFFASRFGRGYQEEDRELFDSLLWFGCDYGPGDPLRWSPVAVEILLTDWLPRKVVADAGFLGRAPRLLRGLIRFSHDQRGIRSSLTEETLAAVDRWEPEYQRAIHSPRPQGPAALLAAMGALDEEGALSPWILGDIPSYEEQMRDLLREAVGDAALRDLDAAPLPDEPLDLSGVAEDVHGKVAEVADLVDACCLEFLDVEHRTACRRLLRDVAVAQPGILRRRGRAETAAAAIVWIVVKANRGFSQREGGLTAKALGEWLGVGSSPGQRAPTLLRAIDAPARRYPDMSLGTPRYLVADRRRWIIEMRDRCE